MILVLNYIFDRWVEDNYASASNALLAGMTAGAIEALINSPFELIMLHEQDDIVLFPLYVEAIRFAFHEESMNLLKLDALSGRNGADSQPMPRAKETLSRVAMTRTSSEKYSNFSLPTSEYSKEQSKSCDICRRSETLFKSDYVRSLRQKEMDFVCLIVLFNLK
ncbi:hypothetical protein AHAS_Ahas11G0192100 [Arachis hypogaea]